MSTPGPQPPRRRTYRNELVALGFLAPNLLGFLLFVAFPILYSFVLVFTNWSLKPAVTPEFLGLENVWRLIGFQPNPEVENSGGIVWFIWYIGSFMALALGLLATLYSVNAGHGGIKTGAGILICTGAGLITGTLFVGLTIGWALFGIMLISAALFLLMTDDERRTGFGMVGPAVALVAVISLLLAREPFLTRWEANDANFYYYLYNTLYLMVVMPFQVIGSLLLALALSRPLVRAGVSTRMMLTLASLAIAAIGGWSFWSLYGSPDAGVLWASFWIIAALGTSLGMVSFRTLFFLPSFTAGVAVMLLWKQVFNPNFGPLNEGLRIIFDLAGMAHLEPPRWLLDPNWAKPALMLMSFWMAVGGANMLLYVAGLTNIPGELYEAAEIDGASKWQAFKSVTWPQLAPTTFFIVIMTTIAGIQGGFEQARVMTQGGPAGSTKTLSYYIYERAFEELELGYASAVAWVLFAIIFALTLMNWKFGNRYVND